MGRRECRSEYIGQLLEGRLAVNMRMIDKYATDQRFNGEPNSNMQRT